MAVKQHLWSVPDPIMERLNDDGQDARWTEFLLCGFYCSVACLFLIIFGIAAILRGEVAYAMVILGFALATVVIYGGIWLSGQLFLARHFVVALMGSLCLYLFYSGGTGNTGPMYYLVFPVVAVFLQGIRMGSVSVITLLLVSLFIQQTGLFGFDNERYSFVFLSRVFSVFIIISILAFLFAWFRERAELQLLLNLEDMESIIHADPLTGLCKRPFMEQVMQLEFDRYKRYGNPFCLMAIRIDDYVRIHQRHGTSYSNQLLAQVAKQLMQVLRNVDIPARWEDDLLLAMMPHSSIDEAVMMADRIRDNIRGTVFTAGKITVSIGISEIEDDIAKAVRIAEEGLKQASRGNGDKVVVGNGKPGSSSASKDDKGLSSLMNRQEE